MKFKVGDKVRVREDLEVGKVYGIYLYKEEMAKLKGKVVEIEDVYSDSYSIKEDRYYWTEEMFSGLAEPRNLMPQIAKMLGVEVGEAERVILENLTKEYKYIARDYYGALYIYENKPKKDDVVWNGSSFDSLNMFQHLFQFIKWEDSEPYNIKELLEE